MGKEIPISVLGVVIVQTVAYIWFLASLSNKVDIALATIQEFKTERYTREDARRDRELADQKWKQQEQLDREQERRIGSNEGRVERLERK